MPFAKSLPKPLKVSSSATCMGLAANMCAVYSSAIPFTGGFWMWVSDPAGGPYPRKNFHIFRKIIRIITTSCIYTHITINFPQWKLLRFCFMTGNVQIFTDFRLCGRGICPDCPPLDPPVVSFFTASVVLYTIVMHCPHQKTDKYSFIFVAVFRKL